MDYPGLSVTTPPTEEPVTLAEAKTQCQIAPAVTAHDTILTRLISAARRQAEQDTHRQILTATYRLTLDRFPTGNSPILLPRPPVQSVTSIQYVDVAGVTQTLATSVYQLRSNREPAEIVLKYLQTWPTTRAEHDAVTIVYVAGYADTAAELDAAEEHLKTAILFLVQQAWLREQGGENKHLNDAAEAILERYQFGDDFAEYC